MTSVASSPRSTGWLGNARPVVSARASDSSWLTVWCGARSLERVICCRQRRASSGSCAQRQVGLHAQPGQRRLELVRRVGQEAPLRGQRT